MAGEYRTLEVGRCAGVVTVLLNRPEKKNAGNPTLWRELRDVIETVDRTDTDRVLVITGAGGNFCSGADLGEINSGPHPMATLRGAFETAAALHELTRPTVAKVDGVAVGAGCNLALGCDLVVASDRARFSEIFVRRGLSVDFGGSWLLPRLVGLRKAKELALLGDILSAAEAAELGLVNRVVAVSELDATVDALAARLAAGPPVALSMVKRLLDDSFAVTLRQALENEARAQAVCYATEDAREGLRAFAEKRDPRFTGR